MLTSNGYLESSKDILPGDTIKVSVDWDEYSHTDYTFTVHSTYKNMHGDTVANLKGSAHPFIFNRGPYLIKLLERTGSTDPIAHGTEQHNDSPPIYSPHCDECIEMFYCMMQAVKLRANGLFMKGKL